MENTYLFETHEQMAEFNTILGPATAETYLYDNSKLSTNQLLTEIPALYRHQWLRALSQDRKKHFFIPTRQLHLKTLHNPIANSNFSSLLPSISSNSVLTHSNSLTETQTNSSLQEQ